MMPEKGILIFLLSGFLVWLFLPPFIKLLKKYHWGQPIRPEGPADHQSKSGTPSLGGVLLILAASVLILIFCGLSPEILILLIMIIANALIGFLDDLIEIKKRRSLGLKARHKLILQLLLGGVLGFYFLKTYPTGNLLKIPLLGEITTGWLIGGALAAMVLVSATNAVNLTDGLDGLAGGLCAVAFLVYALILLKAGNFNLALAALSLAGVCLGFLWFNFYPAKIFMGDTGSLGLGAGLATLAVLSRSELFLLIIGGIFVIETLSVIIQVIYFKITRGKRIFKMSPLHHHFCLLGSPEALVTVRFWLFGILLGGLGLYLFLRL